MSKTTFKIRLAKESYIWAIIVLVLAGLLRYESINKGLYLSTIIGLGIFVLIWYFVFYYAQYTITDKEILSKSISGNKTIDVEKITKIEKGNSLWKSGFFYFWYPYQKGLNIHYGNHEELFVNPDLQEEFIASLHSINPAIEIATK